MNILINIGHPAHVHLFKHFIFEMKSHGHKIYINTVDKEVTLSLLHFYSLAYHLYGKRSNNSMGKLLEIFKRDLQVYKLQKKYDIDIIMGVGDMFGAHVSRFTRAKSIVFTDTEHAKLINSITFPFADKICTPSCFKQKIGNKQIKYNGYHELAYLHPNYFTPNPSVLKELGLAEDDKFIIIRFVSWGASHDIKEYGIKNKLEFVQELEKYGRVLITSESSLGPDFEKYMIKISPEKIHDLLYYSKLFIGESPTMTTESAILGTPAICVSSWACDCGNFVDLSSNYGLIYCYKDEKLAANKAVELLKFDNKTKWINKRNKLLRDKIDVTSFMVDFIENQVCKM